MDGFEALRRRAGVVLLAAVTLLLPALALGVARALDAVQIGAMAAVALTVLAPGFGILAALSRQTRLNAAFVVHGVVLGVGTVNVLLVMAMIAGGTMRGVLAASIVVATVGFGVALLRCVDLELPAVGLQHAACGGLAVAAATLAGTMARFEPLNDHGFHLSRARLLLVSDRLEPLGLTELIGGSDHPGYALPGWHAVLALAALATDVDPIAVIPAVAAVMAAAALVTVWALGGLVHPTLRIPAAMAALVFGFWMTSRWTAIYLPGGGSTILLVPAALTLGIIWLRGSARPTILALVAAGVAISGSHVTYVVPLIALITGAAIGELLQRSGVERPRTLVARFAAAVLALAIPVAVYTVWVSQLASEGRAAAARRQDFEIGTRFRNVLDVGPLTMLDPMQVITVATLAAAVTMAALAAWRGGTQRAPAIIGAAAGLLALAYAPPLFSAFVDIASVSQAQRTLLMLPVAGLTAVAVGGAAGASRRARPWMLALLLGAGSIAALPAVMEVPSGLVAAAIGAIAVAAIAMGRRGVGDPVPWVAAVGLAALLLPSMIARAPASPPTPFGTPLPSSLVAALDRLPAGTGIAARPQVAYRITGATALPVFSSMPTHVALTAANAPYRRNAINRRLLAAATSDGERLALARRNGVDAIVTLLPGSRRLAMTLEGDEWPLLASGPGWRVFGVPGAASAT